MISIRESLAELEKCHTERKFAVDCYVSAIKSVANYTIELDPSLTSPQRQYLNSLAEDASSGTAAVLSESQATLRGLLRDYRDKAMQYLKHLREELEGMAQAMEQIMSAMSQSDGEHDTRLRSALGRLRKIAQAPEGAAIRSVVTSAVEIIEESLEQLTHAHQLTISQLQVEMGVLHKRIDALESAASIDHLTDLFNRREMEERIHDASPPFSLLLARVTGLRKAEVQFHSDVAAELTAAFTKRLRNSLPPSAVIGRWSNEEFVAMLSPPVLEISSVARSLSEQLSGSYACLMAGKTVRPSLQLTIAVVDSAGAPPDRILQRIRGFLSSS